MKANWIKKREYEQKEMKIDLQPRDVEQQEIVLDYRELPPGSQPAKNIKIRLCSACGLRGHETKTYTKNGIVRRMVHKVRVVATRAKTKMITLEQCEAEAVRP